VHNSDLPVVAMSAHVLDEVVRQCRPAAMTGYIDRPIDVDNLVRVLQDVTQGAPGFGDAMATGPAG
jgi:CheY-like chemotaxis protein